MMIIICIDRISWFMHIGSQRDFQAVIEKYATVLLVNFIIIGATLCGFTVLMLYYGVQIHFRLAAPMNNDLGQDRAIRLGALSRVNRVMFVLVLAYTLRLFTLCVIAYDFVNRTTIHQSFSIIGWFVAANWIPFLVPVRHLAKYSCVDIMLILY